MSTRVFLALALAACSPSPTRPTSAERSVAIPEAPAPSVEAETSDIESDAPPRAPEPDLSAASHIPETRRRAIFAAMVRAQKRASHEADRQFPTSAEDIPASALATYDFAQALSASVEEEKRLTAKYTAEVRRKHGISEEALSAIDMEGALQRWPIPQD